MMMGWGAGGDWHAPNMGRTFGWEKILGWSPRGRDRGERKTDRKKSNPHRIWHKQEDRVSCNRPFKNKDYTKIGPAQCKQTNEWRQQPRIQIFHIYELSKNLSLGYSSLKSLLFLVVQSRIFSTFTTISFPCQRPCHNCRHEINQVNQWCGSRSGPLSSFSEHPANRSEGTSPDWFSLILATRDSCL